MAQSMFGPALAQLQSGTLNFAVGNYYLRWCTDAIPAYTSSTIGALPTVGDPVNLTGRTYAGGILKFDNALSNPVNIVSNTIKSKILVKKSGANPANSDLPVAWCSIKNSSLQDAQIAPFGEKIQENFSTNGLIRIVSTTGYQAPPNTSQIDNSGLIYIIGTKNSTQSYVSPFSNSSTGFGQRPCVAYVSESNGFVPQNFDAFNRPLGTFSGAMQLLSGNNNPGSQGIVFDWGEKDNEPMKVKVGTVLLEYRSNVNNGCTIECFGSDNLQPFTNSSSVSDPYALYTNNPINVTQGNFSVSLVNNNVSNTFNLLSLNFNSSTYYRFLIFTFRWNTPSTGVVLARGWDFTNSVFSIKNGF